MDYNINEMWIEEVTLFGDRIVVDGINWSESNTAVSWAPNQKWLYACPQDSTFSEIFTTIRQFEKTQEDVNHLPETEQADSNPSKAANIVDTFFPDSSLCSCDINKETKTTPAG